MVLIGSRIVIGKLSPDQAVSKILRLKDENRKLINSGVLSESVKESLVRANKALDDALNFLNSEFLDEYGFSGKPEKVESFDGSQVHYGYRPDPVVVISNK